MYMIAGCGKTKTILGLASALLHREKDSTVPILQHDPQTATASNVSEATTQATIKTALADGAATVAIKQQTVSAEK